ncbi:MAG: MBL fold metallo-hydrolase [Clostridia bacterium]|nr:MBL fold metallo-hydrolase [Clostridia bacterium]
MKITFLGAAREVTGSMTLIEVGGEKLLVDCGMEQGRDVFENQKLPVDASEINSVLLTHAHIDHSGNLPLLYKQGFRGTIYATRATCGLTDIMLRDCAHIQESDAEWKNRKRKRSDGETVEPLYTLKDAEKVLKLIRPADYGERLRIAEGVEIRFTDVGHLLGSAAIEVWLSEGGVTEKFVFSGDVGNINKPLLKDPSPVKEADYLMLESTYGDRLHEFIECDHVGLLAEVIKRTLDRGGNVVIPSFAVGRTQEILYLIRLAKLQNRIKGHENFRVVVDSPLAEEATSIFLQSDPEFFDEETSELLRHGINPLYFKGLEPSVSAEESKALNFDEAPKVIIAGSGMCEGGRIRHHLKHNLWRPESTILFVGYQTEGTLGRLLLDGAEHVKLFGESIAVHAEIAFLEGSSGHADRDGLINWLKGFTEKPKRVFLNHGEDTVCGSFAALLHDEYGYETFAPYSGTEFDIGKNEFVRITEGIPVKTDKHHNEKSEDKGGSLDADYASKGAVKAKNLERELIEAAKRLHSLTRTYGGASNKNKEDFIMDIRALLDKWSGKKF